MSYLTEDVIDAHTLAATLLRDTDGAVVTFDGVVRNHHEGKQVEAIEYYAYEAMAEKEIEKVVHSVEAEHPDVVIGVVHRLGRLAVGESSIAIACVSSHRAEAFEACRKIIDRVKDTVPIWKKEFGPDGSHWVGWQGTRKDLVPMERDEGSD